MSFRETAYPGAANLIGNVDIPRNVLPTVRSGKRRLDPDGTSTVPYYAGVVGKKIRLSYTKMSGSTVLPDSTEFSLSGNGIATIINDINTAATTAGILIQALDLDGFLTVRNLNQGSIHYIRIDPTTNPSDQAATLLGFPIYPLPGSVSFAGEIAAAPGSIIQSNPQTTTLIAKNDSVTSIELNRPLISALQMVEDLRAELNRDTVVYRDVTLTFSAHATDGTISAKIADDTLRVFIPPYDEIANGFPVPTSLFRPYHVVMDTSGQTAVQNPGTAGDPTGIPVKDFFYATSGTPFTPTVQFATWGTPNGGTVSGNAVTNKDKQPSTAVTSIVGNIIQCSGAAFVTKKVMAGDPVFLQAGSDALLPYSHTGWFAVDAVIDETHIAVRPMAQSEEMPGAQVDGAGLPINKPRWLNPVGSSTLRVAMGRFIPAGDLFVGVQQTSLVSGGSSHTVRLAVGVPFIQTLPVDRGKGVAAGLDAVAQVIRNHITQSVNSHAATAIGGFTSGAPWNDTSVTIGATLQATIEQLIADLASNGGTGVGQSGSKRVGSPAISIAGSSPNSLGIGSVLSQLTELLTDLQTHVNQTSGSHAASSISYAGGGAWADGTTNPATTSEAQFDKIISDLSPSTGSAKIGGAASGTDIAAGTVAAQIANLAVNWLKMSRANTISGAQTFSALITANAGLTAGANQDIAVSGTGHYLFGDTTLVFPAAAFQTAYEAGIGSPTGGSFETGLSSFGWLFDVNVNNTLIAPLYLPVGSRIRSIDWWANKNTQPLSMIFALDKRAFSTNSGTTIATVSNSTSGNTPSSVTSSAINYVIEDNFQVYLRVDQTINGTGSRPLFIAARLVYDFPGP